MSYTENGKEKMMIGIALRTVNQKGKADVEIPEHWNRFYKDEIISKIPGKKSGAIYALYTDYEKDFSKPYTLILGCEVSSLDTIPKGMVGKKIPASTFAVFECKGKYPDSLIHKWQEIWTMPLKRTYTGDFEYYEENFNPNKHHVVKIYIAVEK